jgi:hypothetical protein
VIAASFTSLAEKEAQELREELSGLNTELSRINQQIEGLELKRVGVRARQRLVARKLLRLDTRRVKELLLEGKRA